VAFERLSAQLRSDHLVIHVRVLIMHQPSDEQKLNKHVWIFALLGGVSLLVGYCILRTLFSAWPQLSPPVYTIVTRINIIGLLALIVWVSMWLPQMYRLTPVTRRIIVCLIVILCAIVVFATR